MITLKRLLTWRSQSSAILIHYMVTHNIVTNANLTADHTARESIYTANVNKEVAHISYIVLNIGGSKGGQGEMTPLKLIRPLHRNIIIPIENHFS